MKPSVFLLALTAAACLPALHADEAPAAEPKDATDFLRVHDAKDTVQLQAAVTRYEQAGVTVDLLGAVHIADQAYYDELNQRFTSYDALLFEMIGGENLVDGKAPAPAEGDAQSTASMLGNLYGMISRFLKLTDQKSAIDYSKKNFVHADLTLDEFARLQQEKGESILGFALEAGNQAAKDGQAPAGQPDMSRLVSAFLSGNSDGIKLELVHSLGQGDDQIAAFAGNSVIIGDRNAKCVQVLDKQVHAGKKKIGIFYGAAHYPEMEQRLLKKGFQKTRQDWLPAWDIPQPKKQPAGEQPEGDTDHSPGVQP